MRHIRRVNAKQGWRVRYRTNGVTIDKTFRDSKYGDDEHASLLAALAWRDEMLKKFPYTPYRTKPHNNTGFPGITESYRTNSKGEKIPCFYVAWRPYKGVRKRERFYHHDYDSREDALRAAIAFRKQKEQEILRRYLAGEYDKRKD